MIAVPKSWQKKTITLNAQKFHLNLWGNPQKPLLLFLHGWLDVGASFAPMAAHLEKHYFMIAPDQRGFGKSSNTPNPLGYFFYEYLADVDQMVKRLSPNKPIRLIGHSMGGNIAGLYAGTFPEKVKTLVNIEGFGIRDMDPSEGPGRMRDWIDGMVPRRFRVYKNLQELAKRLQKTNPNLKSDMALFLAKQIGKKGPKGYQIMSDPRHKWVQPYLFRLDQIVPFWQNIQAKTLNIIAENTEMGPLLERPKNLHKAIDQRLQYFPKSAKKIVIKDCGHMIHHEKPEELAKIIRDFVK
ncbi:MAG: alpha/beta hydrolase [Deltaproteobacteria bacterium]|nr:alpha/beta hydrolase [Deltaproteobacteria bacterium]